MPLSPQETHGALTAAQVAALDAAAVAAGVDIVQLMELAGFQVARLAWRMLGARPRHVKVVAGHGNNGGDALVAARHLAAWGCSVSATLHGAPGRLSELMAHQASACADGGVELTISEDAERARPAATAALIVDGLLGTGLSGPPRSAHAAVIAAMTGTRVLSVDVPSGFDADHGGAGGAAVHATATCTLAACKRGFWTADAHLWTGALYVADIGMPRDAWERSGLVAPPAVRGGAIRRVTHAA